MLLSQFNGYRFILLLLILLGFICNIVKSDCGDSVLRCPYGDTIRIGNCYTPPWNCFPCNADGDRDDDMIPRRIQSGQCKPPPRCSQTPDLERWIARADDGCSAPSGISWAVPAQAKSACDMHDLCYAAGIPQVKCDNDFHHNLLEVNVDGFKANIMYQAVANYDSSHTVAWGRANCGMGWDYIQLKTLHNNECLTKVSGEVHPLEGVLSYDVEVEGCTDSDSSKWYYSKYTKQIMSADNGECLDMHQESQDVYLHTCHDGSNQKWTFDPNTKTIKSYYNDECLDMHLESKDVYVHACHNGNNQKWKGIKPDCVEASADYYGNDIAGRDTNNIGECSKMCNEYEGCNAWTFREDQNKCYLKSKSSVISNNNNAYSGLKNCVFTM